MFKTFTYEELLQIIDEEAKKQNVTIIVDQKVPLNIYLEYIMGNVIGVASIFDFSVHIFTDSLQKLNKEVNEILEKLGSFGKFNTWYKDPEREMRKIIKGVIKHEFRHIEQYKYMVSKGVDLTEYLKKENKKPYYFRRHEFDAYLVQKTGIRLPLSWLF